MRVNLFGLALGLTLVIHINACNPGGGGPLPIDAESYGGSGYDEYIAAIRR